MNMHVSDQIFILKTIYHFCLEFRQEFLLRLSRQLASTTFGRFASLDSPLLLSLLRSPLISQSLQQQPSKGSRWFPLFTDFYVRFSTRKLCSRKCQQTGNDGCESMTWKAANKSHESAVECVDRPIAELKGRDNGASANDRLQIRTFLVSWQQGSHACAKDEPVGQ